VYIDGSFVTVKREPGDCDACWDIDGVNVETLDSVFLVFRRAGRSRSTSISASFSPPRCPKAQADERFLEFFQTDKETGRSKGIVGLNLQEAKL
jgi:hypothetical protein